ncbi:MAG TPA: hypothetical protein VLM79_04800 [Kofleriaceae bacterium]|nr:hypothetical protein [Kofleriaceae bacterium]
MRRAIPFGLAMLPAATAFAEDHARPEELFLGDHSWLQERAELQLSMAPAMDRDQWYVGAAAEYGLTSRVQLSLEGGLTDGPHMDSLREIEIGAKLAALRSERWALAIGGAMTAEVADSTELGFEPCASLSFGTGSVGANLAVSSAVTDFDPAVAVALYARFGRLIPLVEAGRIEGDFLTRAGLAVQVGSAQLAAAMGYSGDLGASVHAVLSWEVSFAGGDDHDDDE